MNDKKGKGKFHGKPYDDKKKQSGYGKKPSGGGSSASMKCFKCGVEGHRAVDCTKVEVTCFKCGKASHKENKCGNGSSVTCYNYGEQGQVSTQCDKPKKEQVKGNVFALSGAEATTDDRLIQEQLDVILGMNWLEFNRVYINYFDKTIIFPEIGVKEDLFLSAKQVNESMQDGAKLFMLLATLDVHEKRTVEELSIVCDFVEVFPKDVSNLPPEHEVEFSIDLVHGTSPISMAPYRMCLQGIRIPKGYSSNIKKLVSMKDIKLIGLKSHDSHVLMQQLLPVAIRGILPKNVRVTITRLYLFFNSICNKVLDFKKLDELEDEAAIISC
ncbi:uncharacterized protein LOC131634047 [Vicia villosa]|uniref:uncharacterized protein LOC131634047 n=1 Tax=Vicia villosa TaxID=3911 RepID=UPI00273AD4D4|nr:uncharacterized protein LOC131634047 [Vicia villosa]